ncbi:Hypothetical predicted protein [Mytilus galloprovincialis]|uniref:Endonuclease/exonuclease/phosphatase domain-containing protein n=1 Tax=Mytilus galloprovincialis TaxID=29158 RepID=A0A8B6D722_MYTGA|nr:Hypothetical predicted protein [Mytilus galloprovincialis]
MQVSDVNKINMISQVNPTHDQLDYTTSNSDGNTQPGTSRKRQNSEKDDIENKKLKVTEQLQIPVMGESEKFSFSAIQNLATNITVSFNMLSDRMIQMESSIEAKISAKIESALETKVKEEVGKFKKDIQQDFDRINEKIDNVQKSYDDLAKNKDNGTINSSRAANIVIKNLEYDAREKDDNQITVHKVQALFRDGVWNCRGWSTRRNDNSTFRKLVLEHSNCDILAICESFLREEEQLCVPGYKWLGHNRTNLHRNAVRGSGGVGAFIRSELFNSFDIEIIDKSVEGILWIYFNCKYSDLTFSLGICYLPPSISTRLNDQEKFFENLLHQVYCNQLKGNTIICGDFNARCGFNTDYIEGIDDVIPRSVIDSIENHNGDLFSDFLSDVNFAMLNGRLGVNDYTYISPAGKSVVDYFCVPYEQLNRILDFKVLRMSDVIDSVNYHPESIPDHSILLCDIKCVMKQNSENYDCKVSKRIKRNTKNVPNDFLTDESVQQMVRDTITKIENFIHVDQDIQSAYNEFQELVQREMSNRLPVVKQIQNKRSKSFYKPYWNETLQKQWNTACEYEKQWLKFHGSPQRKKLMKDRYCYERKTFDKLNRKFKRKFNIQKERDLQEQLNSNCKRDFWRSI